MMAARLARNPLAFMGSQWYMFSFCYWARTLQESAQHVSVRRR